MMSVVIYIILFFLIVLFLLFLFLPVRLHLILDEKKKAISLGWFFLILGADLVSKTFELRLFSQKVITRKLQKKPKEKVKKVNIHIKSLLPVQGQLALPLHHKFPSPLQPQD